MHNEISKYNRPYQYEPRTYSYRIFGKTYTRTSVVPVVRENDGMNCDRTVMLPETMAGPGGKIINVRVPQVNHMEMGNHPNMKIILQKAFKGGYHDAFNLGQ